MNHVPVKSGSDRSALNQACEAISCGWRCCPQVMWIYWSGLRAVEIGQPHLGNLLQFGEVTRGHVGEILDELTGVQPLDIIRDDRCGDTDLRHLVTVRDSAVGNPVVSCNKQGARKSIPSAIRVAIRVEGHGVPTIGKGQRRFLATRQAERAKVLKVLGQEHVRSGRNHHIDGRLPLRRVHRFDGLFKRQVGRGNGGLSRRPEYAARDQQQHQGGEQKIVLFSACLMPLLTGSLLEKGKTDQRDRYDGRAAATQPAATTHPRAARPVETQAPPAGRSLLHLLPKG